MITSDQAVESDGRTRRRVRNTDAVVDALLDLIRGGNERPTAADIAARAGVSERTVFRHFDDIDSLLAVAVEHQLTQLAPWLDAPAPTGSLVSRVQAVVDHRVELFELISPVRRVVLAAATARPTLLQGPAEVDRRLRDHAGRAFAAELSALRTEERAAVRHALEAVTSWPTWNGLRRDQALEVATAKRALHTLLTSLLRTASGRPR